MHQKQSALSFMKETLLDRQGPVNNNPAVLDPSKSHTHRAWLFTCRLGSCVLCLPEPKLLCGSLAHSFRTTISCDCIPSSHFSKATRDTLKWSGSMFILHLVLNNPFQNDYTFSNMVDTALDFFTLACHVEEVIFGINYYIDFAVILGADFSWG